MQQKRKYEILLTISLILLSIFIIAISYFEISPKNSPIASYSPSKFPISNDTGTTYIPLPTNSVTEHAPNTSSNTVSSNITSQNVNSSTATVTTNPATISPTSAPPATKASTSVITATPAPKPLAFDGRIENLPLSNSTKQVILVKNKNAKDVKTEISWYEKDTAGKWTELGVCGGYVGKDGMAPKTREYTALTPMGSYGFVFMFGKNKNPGVNSGYEYRSVGKGDFWAANFDNINEYNVWVHFDGTRAEFAKRYGSLYESLNDISVYTYVAVLDYNYGKDKVIGQGSAIFLHEWANKATGGCIATDRTNLLKMLKWLDPTKNPQIVIGTESYLDEVCKNGKF